MIQILEKLQGICEDPISQKERRELQRLRIEVESLRVKIEKARARNGY
jgi:hypothetical protein